MRTDAKIGFAIVGVLLAVLTVYAVVIPRHGKSKLASDAPVIVVPESAPTVTVPPNGAETTNPPVNPPVNVPPVVTPGGQTVMHDAPPSGNAFTDHTDDRTGLNGGSPAGSGIESGNRMQADPAPPVAPRGGGVANRGRGSAVTPPVPGASEEKRHHTAVASASHPYRVRAGQTLISISSEVYGDPKYWKKIVDQNPGLDAKRLKVGARIMIPDLASVHARPLVIVPSAMIAASDVVLADDSDVVARAGTTYRVREGDNLYRIARRYLGSSRKAEALYELNRDVIGSDPTRLARGMVLRLPTAGGTLSADAR